VNPLLKEIDKKEDGSVIFSENMRAIVKYETKGTLEFNITSANEETNLTSVERLTMVMQFIKECTGIPDYLKEGIYLNSIINKGEAYIYKFDYKSKGFSVHLTDEIKQQLGLDHILQITIKNNQIVSGKWSVLKISSNMTRPQKDRILRGFGEIIDNLYGISTSDTKPLDMLECKYIMDTTEGNIKLNWVAFYDNTWNYP
jgi:hypothetical protein